MTAAFTLARMLGRSCVACASTGNTSASLAMFAHKTDPPMQGIVFIGSGKIAYGKLSQAPDYGRADPPDRGRLRRLPRCVRRSPTAWASIS